MMPITLQHLFGSFFHFISNKYMFTSTLETLQNDKVLKRTIQNNGTALSYAEVVERWQSDAAFRTYFTSLLAGCPFEAFFWETPPVTQDSYHQVFEFVLVESRFLPAKRPQPRAFAEHFKKKEAKMGVVRFSNLSGDAMLVVPCPKSADMYTYTHLANFLRKASGEQTDAFWQQLGFAIAERLSAHPMWVSTAGLGVYWLHVRLDSRPKYYRFRAYKQV